MLDRGDELEEGTTSIPEPGRLPDAPPDPAEPWEPSLPEPSPGPEAVPKEDDPGPDA